jgi:hypothetical protein
MKTRIAIVLVACFLIISACKKNALFSGSKIYTLNNYSPGAGYSETFTYNGDGTIATLVRNDGIKIIYYYSANGDTVTAAQVNGLGQTTTATEYVLNSSKYADTAQGEFIAQHNSNTYSYDVNGMWTQVKTYINHGLNTTDNYTNNSAKDAVVIQHVNSANISTYDYYTFYTSNANTIGVQNMGQYYLGVSSANLISTDVKIASNLDTTDIITYQYRYDGSGNVDTMVAYHTWRGNSQFGALVDSITYTYY